MRKRLQALIGGLALLLTGPLVGEVLEGRVVAVTDGDTVRVLTAERIEERVRLATIDAPERKQPFGSVSHRHLSDLVFGRDVTVDWSKRDRWGRIIGRVLVDGRDAGLEQIQAGFAWHYTAYADEQADEDRALYATGEIDARADSLGLWSDHDPTPPWEWRRR
jgi:endonuclease YncB( thermonuclease family)